MIRSAVLSMAASLALLVPMTGCQVNLSKAMGTIKVTRPFEATTEGPSTTDLDVNVPIGNLTVERNVEQTTAVAVSGTIGGEDQETLDAVRVEMLREDGKVTVKATGPKGKSWKADLTIRIPAGVRVVLASGVGNATLAKLDGAIQAKVGVGNLNSTNLTMSQSSKFETGTGDVTIEVDSWAKDQTIDMKAGVGAAKLVVPADAGFTMKATAGVGKVAVSDVSWVEQSGRGSETTETVQGTTRATPDGRTLKITTGVGDVSVRTSARNP